MQGGACLGKTGHRPGTPPPYWGGADPLARQQLSCRESVERSAYISRIIEVPPTDKAIGERLYRVTVVAFQLINQTRGNGCNRAIRYRLAAAQTARTCPALVEVRAMHTGRAERASRRTVDFFIGYPNRIKQAVLPDMDSIRQNFIRCNRYSS